MKRQSMKQVNSWALGWKISCAYLSRYLCKCRQTRTKQEF